MTNIIKIVLQFLDRIRVAFAVGIIHLRPAGDSRFHQMPEMIKGNFLLVALDTFIPFRAWPDQTHISLKHVPKLGQLIQPQLTQPSANPRDSWIALARINVVEVWAIARNHRAKFMDGED